MKKLIEWYYKNASIRKKLVYSYVLLVLIPLLVLGIYSYRISTRNLIQNTEDTMKSNISIIAESLNDSIQRENDNIKYLSYNSNFREKLESKKDNVIELVKELNNSVEPTFWYFITSDENLKGIQIYSPYVENAIGSFLQPLEKQKLSGWYAEHQDDFKTEWEVVDGQIFASRVILDADTSSQPIGYMQIEIFPEELTEPIYQSELLKNGVVLLDTEGNVIGKRGIDNLSLDSKIMTAVPSVEEDSFVEKSDYMLVSSKKLVNGWKLYYYIDKAEISGQMGQLLATTGLVMGICLIIVVLLIEVISRILSSRVLQLKGYAEEVSNGNFEINMVADATDEIGIVEKSFLEMCNRITQMMDEMYHLGQEKKAEELKALQAMINPHFLYNCLSSIKWKAIRAEQDEIADVTGLLAKFYRTTLNGGRQITTVKNEIENINAYLELQKKTHDNSFRVEMNIAEEGRDLQMPNFLLQPIVENAICHGIDYCEDKSTAKIIINYYGEQDFIIFEIMNNGPVLTDEEVKSVLNTPGKGYGLFNIRERINMYYDEECGVFGRLADNGMIVFTVKLRRYINGEKKGEVSDK